jgi:hypothetical protein
MSSRRRFILAIVLLIGMLTLSTIGMATATVYRHGSIRIHVQSDHADGDNINLVFPAALVDVALAVAPLGMVRDEIPVEEIRPFLPVIQELANQIEDLPDAVFVRVTGPRESVLIAKKNGRFIIDVKDGHEAVSISIPVSTVASVMRKAQALV